MKQDGGTAERLEDERRQRQSGSYKRAKGARGQGGSAEGVGLFRANALGHGGG